MFSPQLFLFVTLFQIQKMRFNFYCKEQEVFSVLSIWGKLHHFLSFSWLTLFKSQITFIRKLMIKEIKDVNNNCAVMCNLIFSLYCAFYLHFYLLLFQPLVVCQVVLEERVAQKASGEDDCDRKTYKFMNSPYFGFMSLNKFVASFLHFLHLFFCFFIALMIQMYFFRNISSEVLSPDDGFY